MGLLTKSVFVVGNCRSLNGFQCFQRSARSNTCCVSRVTRHGQIQILKSFFALYRYPVLTDSQMIIKDLASFRFFIPRIPYL